MHAQYCWAEQPWPEAHVRQAIPPVPHASDDVPDWQTPLASQHLFLHVKKVHAVGAAGPHAPPVPASDDMQTAPVVVQSTHWPPLWPHEFASLPERHRAPTQHPAQLAGPHETVLPKQDFCAGSQDRNPVAKQSWQVSPPVPHAFGATPGWHCPLESQHPAGQVVRAQAVEMASAGGSSASVASEFEPGLGRVCESVLASTLACPLSPSEPSAERLSPRVVLPLQPATKVATQRMKGRAHRKWRRQPRVSDPRSRRRCITICVGRDGSPSACGPLRREPESPVGDASYARTSATLCASRQRPAEALSRFAAPFDGRRSYHC
jgi:hypothetical protein